MNVATKPGRAFSAGVPQTMSLVNGHRVNPKKSKQKQQQDQPSAKAKTNPKSEQEDQDGETTEAITNDMIRAVAMQRHAQSLEMLFQCNDGKLLAYSPSARLFYCSWYAAIFPEGKLFEDLRVRDILQLSRLGSGSSETWSSIIAKIEGMQRVDDSLVLEVRCVGQEALRLLDLFA